MSSTGSFDQQTGRSGARAGGAAGRLVRGLTVVVVALLTGCTGDSGGGSPYAILGEPQETADELPPSVRRQAEVDPSSTRLAGEFEELSYWLATDADGHICLVVAEAVRWLATGCGGGTHVVLGHGSTTAHTISDPLELGIENHAGLLFVSDNLAISTTSELERERLAGVLGTAAEYYEILGQPQRPGDRLPDSVGDRYMDGGTRYLGEYGSYEYWIAAYLSGSPDVLSICLVVLEADGERSGHSCKGRAGPIPCADLKA